MASRHEKLGQNLPVPSAGKGEADEAKQEATLVKKYVVISIFLNYQICLSLPSPHLKPQNRNESSRLLNQ